MAMLYSVSLLAPGLRILTNRLGSLHNVVSGYVFGITHDRSTLLSGTLK